MDESLKNLIESLGYRSDLYGISTAAKYLGGMAPCFTGSGLCPKDLFSLADASLWTKELEESVNRLVYAHKAMHETDVIEKSIRDGSGITSGAVCEYDCILSARAKDLDGDVLWQKGGLELDPKMPLLWQHIRVQPIGKHVRLLSQDDEDTRASFAIADVPLGRDAATLLKFGALRKSHGFIPREFKPNAIKKVDGKTIVTGWDVLKSFCIEGSLVSVPSNPRADILKVMSKEADGVCTAFSRGMLKTDVVKAWSKSVFDSRPAMSAGVDLKSKEQGMDGNSSGIVDNAKTSGDGHGDCSCRQHASEAVSGVADAMKSLGDQVGLVLQRIESVEKTVTDYALAVDNEVDAEVLKGLPTPKAGESDDDFMVRCVADAKGLDGDKRVSACMARRRKPKQLGGAVCKDLNESAAVVGYASAPLDTNYLRGSHEWVQSYLRDASKTFLRSAGVLMSADSWVELIGTFSTTCVVCLRDWERDPMGGESKRRLRCFEMSWSIGSDGFPAFSGEPKEVTVGLEVKPKSLDDVIMLAQLGDQGAKESLKHAAEAFELMRDLERVEGFI